MVPTNEDTVCVNSVDSIMVGATMSYLEVDNTETNTGAGYCTETERVAGWMSELV